MSLAALKELALPFVLVATVSACGSSAPDSPTARDAKATAASNSSTASESGERRTESKTGETGAVESDDSEVAALEITRPDTFFQVFSPAAKLCMTTSGGEEPATLGPCADQSNTTFKMVKKGDTAQLVAKTSEKCLKIGKAADGAKVVEEHKCDDGDDQQWRIARLKGNRLQLASAGGEECLTTAAAPAGKPVRMEACADASTGMSLTSASGQEFQFIAPGSVGTGPQTAAPQQPQQQKPAQPAQPPAAQPQMPRPAQPQAQPPQAQPQTPAPAPAMQPAAPEWVTIIAQHSSKCVTVRGASTADNAVIEQQTCGQGDHQRFKLERDAAGRIHIVAKHSGKVIEVGFDSSADDAAIVAFSKNSGHNQLWLMESQPNGSIIFRGVSSGKCLGIFESQADGAHAQLWTCLNAFNQMYRFGT